MDGLILLEKDFLCRYYDEHNPLGKPGEKISAFKPYFYQQMAGYVKDIAWEYRNR